jgi:hypothetical protein
MELVEVGHTGWTDNNRSVNLLCLYLFEYQDAFQMNTNIRIIRIFRIMDIRMRTLQVIELRTAELLEMTWIMSFDHTQSYKGNTINESSLQENNLVLSLCSLKEEING